MAGAVSVVITTFNHAHFLADALASVTAQTRRATEVIVVDDGSTDDPAAVVGRWPGGRLIRQANRGLAAARNTGLRASRCPFVLFLDADDLLTPVAVAAGLACFDRFPDAALVYGAHRRVDAVGRPIGERTYTAVDGDAFAALLRGNVIAMHATVLYRRDVLLGIGGFDETLPRCEDYDVYLRVARSHRVVSHPVEAALYRWHGSNMSGARMAMLRTALQVHHRHRPGRTEPAEWHRAWRTGRTAWRGYYAREALRAARTAGRGRLPAALAAARLAPSWTVREAARRALTGVRRRTPAPLRRVVPGAPAPPVGRVRLGDLDRVEPISPDFGWDRGLPVDRYYIETFLGQAATDVRGRLLEVGDAAYSRRFGGDRVTEQDVLHVHPGNPAATLVGDLSRDGVLPAAAFDCIIATQTLQLVYDLPAAVRNLHDALRPGGVLLVTVPGISPIDRGEWAPSWYWSLTPRAAFRLLADVFGAETVHVTAYGNAFAATAFLQGLAVEEVDLGKLEPYDPSFPIVVSARAQRLR